VADVVARTVEITVGFTVPAIPTAVTTIAGNAAITVSWVHDGLVTDSFTVFPYIAGVQQAGTVVAVNQRSVTIGGLSNGTAYTFTVRANKGGGFSPESAPSGANTPRANQIFGDEFNGLALDPAWVALRRDGDQSNTELQFYVTENVALDGASHLVLTTTNQSITAPTYDDGNPPTYLGANVTRAYRSAAVQWRSVKFTYGTVQVSAQAPPGSNLWAAIWMLGADCETTTPLNPDSVEACNWPNTGSEEIDIAEWIYADANHYNAGTFYGGGSFGPTNIATANAATQFHTYEVAWSAGSLIWRLDGAQVATTNTGVPSTPQFLIIQTAVRVAPTFTSPTNFLIDWVRVTQP
jgi:beta-glucanase (GH16 family)